MSLTRRFINMTFIAGVGFGGWKLREKYEGVKPTSIMARLSQLWDGIVVGFSSEDDGEARKVRQLEENDRRLGNLERDSRNLAAVVEVLKARLDGQSYQHEFPPLPPSSPSRRP